MRTRDAFLWQAEQFIGLPYRWGGDDPLAGFDCSGLVLECGKAIGLWPAKYDMTAANLYTMLKDTERAIEMVTQPGALAFWSKTPDPAKIHHVEIVWRFLDAPMRWLCIGASGGGSKTLSGEDAIDQNAYVKVRPLGDRGMNLFLADPFL